MRHVQRRHAARGGLAGTILVLMLAGAAFLAPSASAHARSDSDRGVVHNVTVEAHDGGMNGPFWFTMPTTIPTGWVEFTFENRGSMPHQAQFFLLKGTATETQLINALLSDPTTKAALAIASAAGGANVILPGQRQNVVQWVQPGHYVVLCFVMGHFARGMHQSFWAVDDAEASRGTDEQLVSGHPRTDGVARLQSFSITVPAAMRDADFASVKVENRSTTDTHEMALMRVPNGTTPKKFIEALTSNGPPPSGFVPVGGMGGLAPRTSGWIVVHLQPGTYAAFCAVPDEETGMPHFLMGMITIFTVE